MAVMGETTALAYGQLAELLKAGMPLPDALRMLAADAEGGRIPAALDRVADHLAQGASTEAAFAGEEPVLGRMLPRIAEAAADTGRLPDLLHELSRWTLAQDRIRRQLRDAVTYPMLVLFLTSGLFLVIDLALGDDLVNLDKELEFIATATMLRIRFFQAFFLLVAWTGLLIPVIWALSGWFSRAAGFFSHLRESLALRLPLIRTVARPLALTRFCSSVALLLRAGVPLHEAIRLGGVLTGFRPYQKESDAIARRLAGGEATETVWEKDWLFPGTVRFMACVGAQRGTLPQAFEQLARLFEIEAEGRGRLVAFLLPPLCLLMLGAMVVCFLALAVLPMFSLLEIFWRLGR